MHLSCHKNVSYWRILHSAQGRLQASKCWKNSWGNLSEHKTYDTITESDHVRMNWWMIWWFILKVSSFWNIGACFCKVVFLTSHSKSYYEENSLINNRHFWLFLVRFDSFMLTIESFKTLLIFGIIFKTK